jgi:hypothetical protein
MTPPGSPELGDRRLLGYRPPRLPAVLLSRDEVNLTRLFLRRYVRWCARSRHHDRVPAAIALYRRLA